MRCNICDASLAKPDYNAELEGYEPCGTCLDVIQDTLDGFKDLPYALEDAFGEEMLSLSSLKGTADESYDPFE